MIAILSLMYESIEQTHNMRVVSALAPLLAVRDLLDLLQDLHLIKSCLHVVGRTLLHLHGDKGAVLEVLAQPDCREMAPSQFLDDHVSIDQHFPNVHRMVAADYVILNAFILRIIVLVQFPQKVFELAALWLGGDLFRAVTAFLECVVLAEQV